MRPAADTPLQASRASAIVTVTASVGVDRAASITLKVRDPRTGKNLTLAPGSRLAGATLRTRGTTIEAKVGTASWFTVTARLPAGQLERDATYRLALVATGTTGKTGELTLDFSVPAGTTRPSTAAPTKLRVVAAVPSGKGGKLTPLNARTLAPVKPGWTRVWPQWQDFPAALSPAGARVAIGTANVDGDPRVVVLDTVDGTDGSTAISRALTEGSTGSAETAPGEAASR